MVPMPRESRGEGSEDGEDGEGREEHVVRVCVCLICFIGSWLCIRLYEESLSVKVDSRWWWW